MVDLYLPSATEIMLGRGTELLEQLAEAGVPASLYAKPPAGLNNFVISKGHGGIPGSVMLWPGATPEITVYGDRSHRQAVVRMKEGARTISREVKMSRWIGIENGVTWDYETRSSKYPTKPWKLEGLSSARLATLFGIQMPQGTRFTAKNLTASVNPRNRDGAPLIQGAITAKAEATDISFLCGIDETSVFVAQLPNHPRSVEGAHAALRPDGVSKKTLRQGEWFFTPVTDKLFLARLDEARERAEARKPRNSWEPKPWSMRSLNGTTHRCHHLQLRNGVYAIGTVRDGRNGHHRDLELETWHKVTRNAEVMTDERMRSPRRFD